MKSLRCIKPPAYTCALCAAGREVRKEHIPADWQLNHYRLAAQLPSRMMWKSYLTLSVPASERARLDRRPIQEAGGWAATIRLHEYLVKPGECLLGEVLLSWLAILFPEMG